MYEVKLTKKHHEKNLAKLSFALRSDNSPPTDSASPAVHTGGDYKHPRSL